MTRSMVGFCAALVALCVLSATGAGATDWVVNTTLDLPDANAGNGVCATSGGQCSLRAAIEESNAQGGSHTVTLSFGFYNLTHTSGTDIVGFQVTADVEIYGAGILSTAIDGELIDSDLLRGDWSTPASGVHDRAQREGAAHPRRMHRERRYAGDGVRVHVGV